MVARRLLIAGGGQSFPTPPPLLTVTALTSAPAGGWSWFEDPRAIHHAGKTYFGYLDGSNGNVSANTVDDGTLTLGTERVIYPTFEPTDDHDSPVFLARASDGYICVGFTEHIGSIYFAVGASAGALPTGLSDVDNLDSQIGTFSAGEGYTYARLLQLSAEATNIYYFFRYNPAGDNGYLSFSKSTDDGASWAARHNVCHLSYHHLAVNGTDRIDVVMSGHPQDSTPPPHSIWHMYYQGGQWYKSDGTHITATQPFDYTEPTEVYDGTSVIGWASDIAVDGSGNPVIVYATYPGAVPGTSATDHRYNYATWNGSAWVSHEIVAAGGRIPTSDYPPGNHQEFYSGGVILDHSDPTIVYASVNVGSGRWDIYRYQTTDGGATWSSVALTSSGKNVRPVSVLDHDDSLQVIWMEGTYANYTSYSVRTMGAGT